MKQKLEEFQRQSFPQIEKFLFLGSIDDEGV